MYKKMISKEEIEKAKEDINSYIHDWLDSSTNEDGYEINPIDDYNMDFINNIKTLLQYIKQLERQNRKLKIGLNNGLDKDKKTCFYEDGHTGRCLGYSFFNNDEPCIYCKTCEALSIKEED